MDRSPLGPTATVSIVWPALLFVGVGWLIAMMWRLLLWTLRRVLWVTGWVTGRVWSALRSRRRRRW